MNKFIEFCIKNEIRFNISDETALNISDEGYYDDENRLKVIEIALYKYRNKVEQYIKLSELRDEGLKLEDVCYYFARDFNDFCEKVGE